MAWAPSCCCTATFGRCAAIQTWARPATQHFRPSPAPPTTWTSWTTMAGADRALGTALVSSTRRRTSSAGAGKKPPTTTTKPVQPPKTTMELSFDVASGGEAQASGTSQDHDHFRQNFVRTMREMLRDPDNPYVDLVEEGRVVRQVPRLRSGDTIELMNLTLHIGDEARVTLSLRTDNLYVIGFRNGQGTWFEFHHENRPEGFHMIPESNLLRFTGSYLGDGIGNITVNHRIRNEPILGRWAVEDAIRGLASYNGAHNNRVPDQDALKRFLRTLVINFIESVRFDSIVNRVAPHMTMYPPQDIAERRLTERNITFIHRWGSLSSRALHPTTSISIPELDISSMSDLLRELGMVLIIGAKIKTQVQQHKRPRRSVVDHDDNIGLTLAEVVGVVIRNINDCNPGKLYGTITLTDGLGSFQLYNRDKDHYQEVGPGGKADLAYPPRPISGADDFVIDVDLMDHYSLFGSDRKVALDQVAWNSRDTLSADYNTVLKVPVTGEHGEVEVQYAVLTDAVVAKVEVVLVDSGNRVFSPDVYGSITATTTMASGEPLQYSLFEKARDGYVAVPEKAAIPLQRKLVSAPMGTGLEVSASLWDANALTPDDHFVNGSVVFTPRIVGTDSQTIMGSRGIVRLQVTWSTTYEW